MVDPAGCLNRFRAAASRPFIPEQPDITIPCYMFVPPMEEITPTFITVRPPLTQDMRRTVLIRDNGEGTMKITSVQTEPTTITAQMTEQTPGKALSLQVMLPAGLTVSSAKPGKLALITNLKDKPTITIENRPAGGLSGRTAVAK
jgi:hypothetical protein